MEPYESDPLDLACFYCNKTARQVFAENEKKHFQAIAFQAAVDDQGRTMFICGDCARNHYMTLRHGTLGTYHQPP